MSKKKKKILQAAKPVNKRLRIIVGLSIALALAAGGVLTWYLVTKEPPLIVQYNGAMTAKAQASGYISPEEVIIVHTVDESAKDYITLQCYVYQLPEGVKAEKMLKYYAHELPEKWNLEPVGEASARFIRDDLSSLYSVKVSLTK